MSFTKTFPYDTGTIVKVPDKDGITGETLIGSIACYGCVRLDDDFTVVVSGLKEPWCGEYYYKDVIPATKEEIRVYCEKRGIEEEEIQRYEMHISL